MRPEFYANTSNGADTKVSRSLFLLYRFHLLERMCKLRRKMTRIVAMGVERLEETGEGPQWWD